MEKHRPCPNSIRVDAATEVIQRGSFYRQPGNAARAFFQSSEESPARNFLGGRPEAGSWRKAFEEKQAKSGILHTRLSLACSNTHAKDTSKFQENL